jgi:FAD synthetase
MSLSENPAERAERYIKSFESALQKNRILAVDSAVKAANIKIVSDALQRYLKDARYYLENQKPTTSLASIAYAEGLLDALAYLGLAKPLE